MKVVLMIVGCCVVGAFFFFLYRIQLGAIPFLLGSILLFYISYRFVIHSTVQQENDEEDPDAIKIQEKP
ncbi:hypothetical protein [Bacillus sp. FJAT-50079]|uniref:hypothetical protein n=1 Tax=Bacillus sp. FJAT-50079 TaxID=2833577 RepID=UPI001BC90C17|nr:hypothetical protein [Bacillus sp. FJAT-50079]MBS4206818.1 hypothetical protein [Bacillus sp. FJAT-50079]